MIIIDKLEISDDKSNILLEAHVKTDSYFDDVYIDTVKIDTQSTYIEEGPSDSPVYTKTIEGNMKEISLTISKNEVLADLSNDLFFVYLTAKGTPSSGVPCGQDVKTVVGVCYNNEVFYNKAIYYVKEITKRCCVPENFIDFILQYEAYKVSIKTGHYLSAIKFWNLFFKTPVSVVNKKCNCHG